MIKEMICISCPMGCRLTVDYTDVNNIKVTGNTCPRGVTYAVNEITAPKRMVTGSVKVTGGNIAMVSVKTKDAIPKELIFNCLEALNNVTLTAPVHINDVVVANVCGCGVDVIATKEIPAK